MGCSLSVFLSFASLVRNFTDRLPVVSGLVRHLQCKGGGGEKNAFSRSAVKERDLSRSVGLSESCFLPCPPFSPHHFFLNLMVLSLPSAIFYSSLLGHQSLYLPDFSTHFESRPQFVSVFPVARVLALPTCLPVRVFILICFFLRLSLLSLLFSSSTRDFIPLSF